MGTLAIVGGSAIRGLDLSLPGAAFLQRHGTDRYVLPHRIDHVANMRFLAEAGCDRVLGIGSVGSLRPELGPGAFLCPDDFIALDASPSALRAGRASRRPPRSMAAHAQVVGMTIASECIAAAEAGLAYAAVCVVENLANGAGGRELAMDDLLAGRAANRVAIIEALERLLPELA